MPEIIEIERASSASMEAEHDSEDFSDIEEVLKSEDLLNSENDSDESLRDDLLALVPLKQSKDLETAWDKIDPLTLYLKEIGKYELLSIEKEKALTKALSETGDIEIARKLVVANLRLVVKIAMDYKYAYSNVMDLIQEGNVGLMKAVSKYDPTKGAKLSYYASWWIKSYILKFILDNFRLVRIGTTNDKKKLFYNLLKEKNRLLSLGLDADAKSIGENLGVSEKSVIEMEKRLAPGAGEVGFDSPVGKDGEGKKLSEVLETDDDLLEDKVAKRQEMQILNTHLKDFLEGLKPRDLDIFKKRLLLEAPLSLQAIADEYGVSRERIRQIEERLLKNLKVYMSDFLR